MARRTLQIVACVVMAGIALHIAGGDALGQGNHPAVNNPDKLAWDLFVQLNHPADLGQGRGIPDPNKKVGVPGVVVWETWKLARTEVFLPTGEEPPAWDAEMANLREPLEKEFEPPKTRAALNELFPQVVRLDPKSSTTKRG